MSEGNTVNIIYPGTKKPDMETILSIINKTDLGEHTKKLAGNYSSGMKRRLSLACALITTHDLNRVRNICDSAVMIITFSFSDEKSVSFAVIPCLLTIVGIFIANDYVAANSHSALSCIITIVCAIVATFVAYKFYKTTKYFLKI